MLNSAPHILLGDSFRRVPLLLTGVDELLPLHGMGPAHLLDGGAEGGGEERDDGPDVGRRVDGVPDLGFKRVEFNRLLDVEVERETSRAGERGGVSVGGVFGAPRGAGGLT